jgi:hypothetical protein
VRLVALENILLFAPSRVCFSKARANAVQKVVLGLFSSTCGTLQELRVRWYDRAHLHCLVEENNLRDRILLQLQNFLQGIDLSTIAIEVNV